MEEGEKREDRNQILSMTFYCKSLDVRVDARDIASPNRSLCLGCLGVMRARNQRSATMNPPGVAGHAGGLRAQAALDEHPRETCVAAR